MSKHTWDFGGAAPAEYRCGRCGAVLSQADAPTRIAELERDIETYDGMALNDSFKIDRLEAENAALSKLMNAINDELLKAEKEIDALKEENERLHQELYDNEQ